MHCVAIRNSNLNACYIHYKGIKTYDPILNGTISARTGITTVEHALWHCKCQSHILLSHYCRQRGGLYKWDLTMGSQWNGQNGMRAKGMSEVGGVAAGEIIFSSPPPITYMRLHYPNSEH